MIVTRDLSKQFDQFWAVDGVNLNVQPGELLALLGPNGAGKTTTVRMLTSVLTPTRGEANIAGYDILRDAQKVRASVGVLTEQHGLYGRMPADEYLDFFGQIYGLDAATRRSRANALMETFGLLKDSRRRIAEYSKGMRQKLALVRAMLHDPPVLLLDEPTSAMDPESARLVRDSIQELRSASRAIIICTHNLAEAEELADYIAIIRQGKIVASGAPGQLKRDLLGPVEYEVHFGALLNGQAIPISAETELTGRGANWIRFRTARPESANPALLQSLLSQGFPVVSIHEMPRSLEQVYLQVMNTSRAEEEQANA